MASLSWISRRVLGTAARSASAAPAWAANSAWKTTSVRSFTTLYDDPAFPVDHEGRVIHLDVKPGEVANRILCVGDTSRCKQISKLLDAGPHFEKTSHREFHVVTGTYNNVPVSIIATLMGFPNTDFVVRESRHVVKGPMAMIRFGSCGGLQDSKAGSVAVATDGCISIMRNPAHWSIGEGPPYILSPPIPGDAELTDKLLATVTKAVGEEKICKGINVSADTFYASQGRDPRHFDDRNEGLLEWVEETYPKVVSCEMETNHLFDLASMSRGSIRVSGVAMVYANRHSKKVTDPETVSKLIDSVGAAALDALTTLELEDTMDGEECVWNH